MKEFLKLNMPWSSRGWGIWTINGGKYVRWILCYARYDIITLDDHWSGTNSNFVQILLSAHWWLPTVLLKRDEGVDILTCTSIHRKIRSILGIVIVAQKVMRWYFLSTAKEGGGKNGHF